MLVDALLLFVDDAGIFGFGRDLAVLGLGGGELGFELLDLVLGLDVLGVKQVDLKLKRPRIDFETARHPARTWSPSATWIRVTWPPTCGATCTT